MLIRRPEVRRTLLLCGLPGAAVTALTVYVNKKAGILVGALCLLYLAVYLISSARRYRAMARLAADLDAVLFGKQGVTFSQYKEGEISLLRTQLQKLVVRLSEQAQQLYSEKLELAEAMADISHQIRTPLTAVNLLLAELSDPDTGEQAKKAAIFALRRQMDRMDWLVNSLLKMAKLDAGTVSLQPQTISMQELIQRAAEPLAVLMEIKGQTLEQKVSGRICCDLNWTAEALGNILKNCTEHMNAGCIHISAEENAVCSCIRIRDEGGGIAPEDLPHLFERYYKGKNASEQSVGIGLALSRSIVAAQNGTLSAANRSGGAEFTLKIYKSTI